METKLLFIYIIAGLACAVVSVCIWLYDRIWAMSWVKFNSEELLQLLGIFVIILLLWPVMITSIIIKDIKDMFDKKR